MAKVKMPEPTEERKDNKPDIKPVVTGKVNSRERGIGSKILGLFASRDINELKTYAIDDVIFPGMLKMAHAAVDIAFKRDVRSYSTEKRRNTVTAYDRASQGHSSVTYGGNEIGLRKKRDFRELIFEDKGDALEVLSSLVDLTGEYGQASIADLYDLCEVTSEFTDNKYGWTNLQNADIRRVSEGYILVLPKAEQLSSIK